ncbi:MAG TPA: hypothetical protein VF220_02980 [Nitrososphaeraceae archaeon]
MSKTDSTLIRISHMTWKKLNQEREPRDTFDDVIKSLIDERNRLKLMISQELGVSAK